MTKREVEVLVRCPKGWHPGWQTTHYEDFRDCRRCEYHLRSAYTFKAPYPDAVECSFDEEKQKLCMRCGEKEATVGGYCSDCNTIAYEERLAVRRDNCLERSVKNV